jgi:hypothetical protein
MNNVPSNSRATSQFSVTMTHDLESFLPRRIVAAKGILAEHHFVGDSGILDPNRFLKVIMGDYNWEIVFQGIRTTMSRWEYCILRYFAEELQEAAWSNVLHSLSRNMSGFPETDMYRHPSLRYTRIGLGPGSRSNLRKNSRDYSAIFQGYYGAFSDDELIIGDKASRSLRRFAKALFQHGRTGHRLLEKGSSAYHRIRKNAARYMLSVLNNLNEDKRYLPPRAIWGKLPEDPQWLDHDLVIILKFRGANRHHPAFWRLALASAATKVLYGFKFTGEENAGVIGREFAELVLKLLCKLGRQNNSPELADAIEAIRISLAKGYSYYKPPFQNVYAVGGRDLIIQNFRIPTWLNLCRQARSAERDQR